MFCFGRLTRRSGSGCWMTRSGAVMIASDLVLNPASCECWLVYWHSYLFLSAPSPLRPPCPGLAFCRLGRGSGGRPLCFASLFPLFFLLSGIASGFTLDGDLPSSRSGYPFWLKANCDPFRAQATTGFADRCRRKTSQQSCATPPK